jgi:hopanoid biosynthesis associated protein HpnK
MKRLIITGDDFGLSLAVNEAIEESHRKGVLSTASLMVGAKASADAMERARRLPTLRVGLHIVLVEGSPVLPPREVPDLVDERGLFSSHLIRAGINFFFRPKVRRQLEAEIRAQFQAFQETGLPMDHVNTHHHIHLHPTVSGILLKVGKEYGLRAIRLPYEPLIPSWRASRKAFFQKMAKGFILYPWISLLKKMLRGERIRSNDFLFGMNDSGNMNLYLVLRFLKYLPNGVTEIYFHPVISKINDGREDKDIHQEMEALKSPEIRETLLTLGIQQIAFSDLERSEG